MMGFKSPAQRFTNNTYEIDGIFEHYLGAESAIGRVVPRLNRGPGKFEILAFCAQRPRIEHVFISDSRLL